MSNSSQLSFLKWLVLGVIFAAALFALLWLLGFARFFTDLVLKIIHLFGLIPPGFAL